MVLTSVALLAGCGSSGQTGLSEKLIWVVALLFCALVWLLVYLAATGRLWAAASRRSWWLADAPGARQQRR